MAATISTFMVRCGSIYLSNKSKSYKEKLNIIGTHYSSLSSIKTVTVFTLNHLTTNDGIRCFKPLTSKESEAFRNFQADIQPNKTIEENFMVLLTKEFVEKQLQMIDALTIQGMNANPLLCSALNLNTIEDFIRFYAFQAVYKGACSRASGTSGAQARQILGKRSREGDFGLPFGGSPPRLRGVSSRVPRDGIPSG